jgi:hypothetical protein
MRCVAAREACHFRKEHDEAGEELVRGDLDPHLNTSIELDQMRTISSASSTSQSTKSPCIQPSK